MFKVNNKKPFSSASIVVFEHVNVSLVHSHLILDVKMLSATCQRWMLFSG